MKNNLHIVYRLSDMGENKERLDCINNKSCLENFLQSFEAEQMEVVADNVKEETMQWLETYPFKHIHRTSLGNSGSFWFACQLAFKMPPDDFVYLVENDYIHRPGAGTALLEGLQIADYVTLYDHPDKYVNGMNPKVKDGGERSKVFLTNTTHWKITNSSTMTFAVKVSTLQKDSRIFKAYTVGIINGFPILKRFQARKVPADYNIFSALLDLKSRKIICPIPGFSTHGEKKYLSPLIDWAQYMAPVDKKIM